MVTIERRAGVVHSVRPGEVVVRIQQQSACSGCHAKDFCCSTDCADRDISIQTSDGSYRPGDRVFVEGRDSIGRMAVLLSFVIPIILFVLVLALGLRLWAWGELSALAAAFGSLGLYYLLLRLMDPSLGRIMRFEITKAE
ncbi:MAG: SoxR reducing system RseC family protein [Porphyromonas sp.]|nr:SoxR reducing system RseC family protein [Porphyromonas sp.]